MTAVHFVAPVLFGRLIRSVAPAPMAEGRDTGGVAAPPFLVFLAAAGIAGIGTGFLGTADWLTVVAAVQSLLVAGLLVQCARSRRTEARLRVSYEQARRLRRSLLSAHENERANLAREVHDDISQQMAVLQTELHLLARRDDAAPLRRELQDITARSLAVSKGLHDLSHRLHPAYVRLVGLTTALEGLRRDLSTSNVAIAFSHAGVPDSIAEDVKICLFRVAQEALSNAIRHSSASHIKLELHGEADNIVMTIEDNGTGFDPRAVHSGLGLVSMSERVERVGGTLQLRSAPAKGTRLEIRVRWSGRTPHEAHA